GNDLISPGPDGDHRNGHIQILADEAQVILRRRGQVGKALRTRCILRPALERLVDRLDLLQSLDLARKARGFLAVVSVRRADLDLIQAAEHIELGDGELCQTVDHGGVAQRHEIEPSTSARPAGGRTKLIPDSSEPVSDVVGQLGGEWAIAYARAVGLPDADHAIDGGRRNAETGTAPSDGRVTGCHEWIRPEIDIEQRALRSLRQYALAFSQRIPEILGGVGNVGIDQLVE